MMTLISIDKGKILFQVLFAVLFQCTTIASQFNLYNTDETFKSHPLQYDCLNYRIRREKLAFQDLPDVIDDVIPYCFRPKPDFHKPSERFVHPFSQNLSFEELSTNEHHANCLEFKQHRNFTCPSNNYCQNDKECLQDHPTCPSTKICLCESCFFGNQCQFYAKGLGSTLDEILGYEFKQNTNFIKQPMTVKMAFTITLLLFVIGLINSILSIITFSRPKSQEVGAGRYLLASSITSLLTSIALLSKFWFLFYSHQDSSHLNNIVKGNCFVMEPILKLLLYLAAWLNACVAIERTITVMQGITFNKQLSKKVAPWIISIFILTIIGLYIPQFSHLHIFNDPMEERSWCVVKYVQRIAKYSAILAYIHYFAPLGINVLSTVWIMVVYARQGSKPRSGRKFYLHLQTKMRKNKPLIISSLLIICLTSPHLIISILLDCQKSSNLFWFYLIGYYMSFCPAAFIFVIFVLPTRLYRLVFNEFIADIRRYMARRKARSQLTARPRHGPPISGNYRTQD